MSKNTVFARSNIPPITSLQFIAAKKYLYVRELLLQTLRDLLLRDTFVQATVNENSSCEYRFKTNSEKDQTRNILDGDILPKSS